MRAHQFLRLLFSRLSIVVLAASLFPSLARAQFLTYSPASQTLFGGGNYPLSVTAPAETGAYQGMIQFFGTGDHPIPANWISIIPPGMSFSTGSSQPDTKFCLVNVAVPAGTAAGSYTGKVLVTPFAFSVGGGDGATITVVVLGLDNAPPVLNLPPALVAEATGPMGTTVTFTATASDETPSNPVVTCIPPSGSTFPLGTTTVSCSSTDAAGNAASGAFSVIVTDTTAPSMACPPAPITAEATSASGTVVTFSASATDVVDGALVPVCVPPSGSTFSLGSTTVICTSADAHGNTGQCSFPVIVTDTTAPSLEWSANPAPSPAATKTAVSGTVRFNDNTLVSSLVWNWGDGTSSPVNPMTGSGSDSEAHSYSVPGVYSVQVTATDEAGNTAAVSFQYVVVYDPLGSFVTGGGRVNSPRGAYLVDPSLSGQATFGFNAKYRPGASKPSGSTEFQLGTFKFHAETYDWLVVNGTVAEYSGTGTINGTGLYAFQVTIVDGNRTTGGSDAFGIQIWDPSNSRMIYQTQAGTSSGATFSTPISAGSIVVHSN